MPLAWLLQRFAEHADSAAIIWRDRVYTYGELASQVRDAARFLTTDKIASGDVVIIDADFSPASIGLLLAAINYRSIVVPVAAHVKADREKYGEITQASRYFKVLPDDTYEIRRFDREVMHELSLKLKKQGNPGLVLFSSGSTGEPKAALHNLDFLLNKYKVPRHSKRTIVFLLFDHIGGFNTLFYTLANHGCVIALEARDPVTACRAIERHRAELLPTSPTFLHMMLMSEAYRDFDLSSLELITYGTEAMPENTLKRLNEVFPNVRFLQTYGLSELGILRSRSRDNDSLWVKVGGEDYQTRIVDGVLHIKAKSSMLGYLNHPSPFDEDGWFNTHDEVEVDGEWLRFKGRKSDIINVGGEKVYPAEVESILMEVDDVVDATVTKESHPITGNIVVAEVRLRSVDDTKGAIRKLQSHCYAKLPRFKVPVKIRLTESDHISDRFKKVR
jgi:acyl-coenzyme A synthetase/AMP-(fatty) acid ligase